MELQFEKKDMDCLRNLMTQVQRLEQTQEVTVPEGREASDILGTWGQILLRSKERQGDRLLISGGIQARVLLAGGEGEAPQCVDAWIPLKMDWDLPESPMQGSDRIRPVLASMDARWTGAGKLLIRAAAAAMAECWHPETVSLPQPVKVPDDVQLQKQRWPLRLPREVGEKTFSLEENLMLPASAPAVEQILSYGLEPVVTDQKVLTDKLVFRGNANVHLLYLCSKGLVHSWDGVIPFSQYDDLRGSYSSEAQADVIPVVTRLELESSEAGELLLRAGLTGQYLVEDRQILETVTDAFSPRREVAAGIQRLTLPVILDSRRELLRSQEKIPVPAEQAADVTVLTDLPRFSRCEMNGSLELPQCAQVLFYDEFGHLRSTAHRWIQTATLATEESSMLRTQAGLPQTRLLPGPEGIMLEAETPVTVTTMDGEGIPAVTGLTLGDLREPDPGRPSLILQRAGADTLWELARRSGSTVEAIRRANGLEEEPAPGQMLLIPVI